MFPSDTSKQTRKTNNFMLHEPVAGFFLIIKNIVSAFKLHSLKSFIVKLFSSSFPPLALTLMRLFFARINF